MLFYLALIVSTWIYWPLFTVAFGIHNDYSLLATLPSDMLGFAEAKHMLMIGRFIGGMLISWQGVWTPSIEAFEYWRISGFILTLLAMMFLLRMMRLRGLSQDLKPWAILLFMTLPSINIGFVWVVQIFPGAVNLLLSFIAYRLFDRSLNGYRLINESFATLCQLIGALLLVFISLWIYFPTACGFLLLGYIKILWPKEGEKVLGLWIRDICFFGGAVLIYVFVDRFVIYQWVVATTAVVSIDPEYTIGLSKNILHKWDLLAGALIVSWQGLWHAQGPLATWICLAEVVTFMLILFYGGCRWVNYWFRLLVNTFAAFFLLVMTQLPGLLAVGINSVKGYRVMVIAMLAFAILKVWMIDGLLRQIPGRVLKPVVIIWLAIMAITAAVNIKLIVNRHQAELMGLERAVIMLRNDPKVRTIDVRTLRLPKDMLNNKVLSEYSYTMNLKQHLQPAFDALCIKHQLLSNRYRLNVLDDINPVSLNDSRINLNLGEILP